MWHRLLLNKLSWFDTNISFTIEDDALHNSIKLNILLSNTLKALILVRIGHPFTVNFDPLDMYHFEIIKMHLLFQNKFWTIFFFSTVAVVVSFVFYWHKSYFNALNKYNRFAKPIIYVNVSKRKNGLSK